MYKPIVIAESHLVSFGSKFLKTIHDGLLFVTALMTHDFLKEIVDSGTFDTHKLIAVCILIVVTIVLAYGMKTYNTLKDTIDDQRSHLYETDIVINV